MVATKHTQSLSAFRQNAAETLERLNRTGQSEILTVNGEARAVLVAPAVFDELAREAQLSIDVLNIRKAMMEIDEGKGMDVETAFASIDKKLKALKAAQEQVVAK